MMNEQAKLFRRAELPPAQPAENRRIPTNILDRPIVVRRFRERMPSHKRYPDKPVGCAGQLHNEMAAVLVDRHRQLRKKGFGLFDKALYCKLMV
jgi:hypothetical protein